MRGVDQSQAGMDSQVGGAGEQAQLHGQQQPDRVDGAEHPRNERKVDPTPPQARDHLNGQGRQAQQRERLLEGREAQPLLAVLPGADIAAAADQDRIWWHRPAPLFWLGDRLRAHNAGLRRWTHTNTRHDFAANCRVMPASPIHGW